MSDTALATRPTEQTETSAVDTRHWESPLVDIVESAEEIRVIASMPGVESSDIDVNFEKGILRLRGRVRSEVDRQSYLLCEFAPSGYERSFRISEAIDATRIEATYENGVLTLRLPKAESAKPRSIPVTAK
ncbi:MAG: Hsp20/alpha crystallin family protein [Planctomycetes bacterium]|nr:Hsp20/alpha crystallin family protein [Planctomycetota bacterium]